VFPSNGECTDNQNNCEEIEPGQAEKKGKEGKDEEIEMLIYAV